MRKRLLYLFLFLTFISCSKDNSNPRPIGQWDDIIKLSQKEATIPSTGGSIEITTQGDWWWPVDARLDNNPNYDFSAINLLSGNYTFKEDCVQIERKDFKTIIITMDENNTNALRTLLIGLEAGDYFDHIIVKQPSNIN